MRWLKALLRRFLVAEVPLAISPCLDCDRQVCPDFNKCPHRLAQIACEIKAGK